MRAVNQKARVILDKLNDGLQEINSTRTIKNTEGFMPVVVEKVGQDLFSIAHHYTQNSDLMADPEMVFYRGFDGNYYPASYKLDGLGLYQESIVFNEAGIKGFRPRPQKDHAVFAGTWMNNIKVQQGL